MWERKIDSRKSTISTWLWHGVVTLTGASIRWKARCWHRRQRRQSGNKSDSSQMNPSPQWIFRMSRIYHKLWAESTNARVFLQPWDHSSWYVLCWCIQKTSTDHKISVNVSTRYHARIATKPTLVRQAFGLQLQEHRQSQRDIRAYTRSTSRSLASEQNKSALTDSVIPVMVFQLQLELQLVIFVFFSYNYS